MRIGRLDRRITLQRLNAGLDTYGDATQLEAFTDGTRFSDDTLFDDILSLTMNIASVWASVTPLRGIERFSENQIEATFIARFVIRWSNSVKIITAKDLISHGGRTYNILTVKALGANQFIELDAYTRAEAATRT